MGPVIVLGGVIILLALAVTSSKAQAAPSQPTPSGEPPKLKPPLRVEITEVPTVIPSDAKSADLERKAEQAKDPIVKDQLQTQADIIREAEKREVRIPSQPPPPSTLKSITDAAWKEYVKRSVRGTVGMKSPAGAMGIYQLGGKALNRIGWTQLDSSGKIVKWIHPGVRSEREYLSDPEMQYKSFALFTEQDLAAIVNSPKKWIDRIAAGTLMTSLGNLMPKLTLSGILGLTYYAGLATAERFLTDPAFAAQSPKLQKEFLKFNGLF